MTDIINEQFQVIRERFYTEGPIYAQQVRDMWDSNEINTDSLVNAGPALFFMFILGYVITANGNGNNGNNGNFLDGINDIDDINGNVNIGNILDDYKIMEYTEKSFLLTGDTKPIKDELKKIQYCSYNRNAGGWVFSKKKILRIW